MLPRLFADGKTFKKPRRPFEKERLDAELKLVGEYGLRNKRELWRVQAVLSKIRNAARTLLTLEDKDPKRIFEGNALMRRMNRYGLLSESQDKLDYVLALTPQVRAGPGEGLCACPRPAWAGLQAEPGALAEPVRLAHVRRPAPRWRCSGSSICGARVGNKQLGPPVSLAAFELCPAQSRHTQHVRVTSV